MGGPFHEVPYPQLGVTDFGPAGPFHVSVDNGGRTIAIGDPADAAFHTVHTLIPPRPDAVDVVIHGLPGRFIEKLGGSREIPAAVVAELLESAGVQRGTPLRLLTCHAAEAPASGAPIAQSLATAWGGPVSGPDGLLHIGKGYLRVDLVEWEADPVSGGMLPQVRIQGGGSWVTSVP